MGKRFEIMKPVGFHHDKSAIAGLTLPQVLAKQAESWVAETTALREKAYGIWQSYTWQDYFNYVRRTAQGFLSLGLKRGETVAIVSNNHPEWLSAKSRQAPGAVTESSSRPHCENCCSLRACCYACQTEQADNHD